MTQAIVIFGAAVAADGGPSPALGRRIAGGLAAARGLPGAPVFCSGAAEAPGRPSEAEVMRRALLAAGVASDRVVLDDISRDTLQSAAAAARYVRREGLEGCIVCSDTYHLPRIRLLLALLGVPSSAGPVASGLVQAGLGYWIWMSLREAAALPYDAAIVLVRRRALLAAPPSA